MKEVKYDLDFNTIIKELVENNAWAKGENFKSGFFIKMDSMGRLVIVDANNFYIEEPFCIIRSLYRQKFRLITIATIKELSKQYIIKNFIK